MTIEITHDTRCIYRIRPENRRIIERKEAGGRWKYHHEYADRAAAKTALLGLASAASAASPALEPQPPAAVEAVSPLATVPREAVEPVELHYDGYRALAAADRVVVEAATRDILRLQKRRAADLIAIGQHWLEVKERLDHGEFIKWLEVEFNYRYQAANEEMNIARRFGNAKYPIIGLLTPTALRLLSAPSVPASAVDKAISYAEHFGESPSVERIKLYIRDARRIEKWDASKPAEQVDLIERAAGQAAVRAFFDNAARSLDVEPEPAAMTIDVEPTRAPTVMSSDLEPALSAEGVDHLAAEVVKIKEMRRALLAPAYAIPAFARGGEYATLVLPSDLIALLAAAAVEGALADYVSDDGAQLLLAAIDLTIIRKEGQP